VGGSPGADDPEAGIAIDAMVTAPTRVRWQ